ncbi:MAG: hypothetical protein K9J77_10145 [Rhodoferax sp.]|nr:hypothetical protein [Rhodoferax sp.]
MKTGAIATSDKFSRQQFDDLCAWIEGHLDETIGWHQMFQHSALAFATIQTLFYKYASTTPMIWISNRRKVQSGGHANRRPVLAQKRRARTG